MVLIEDLSKREEIDESPVLLLSGVESGKCGFTTLRKMPI
jgi:hypothetical protein